MVEKFRQYKLVYSGHNKKEVLAPLTSRPPTHGNHCLQICVLEVVYVSPSLLVYISLPLFPLLVDIYCSFFFNVFLGCLIQLPTHRASPFCLWLHNISLYECTLFSPYCWIVRARPGWTMLLWIFLNRSVALHTCMGIAVL